MLIILKQRSWPGIELSNFYASSWKINTIEQPQENLSPDPGLITNEPTGDNDEDESGDPRNGRGYDPVASIRSNIKSYKSQA